MAVEYIDTTTAEFALGTLTSVTADSNSLKLALALDTSTSVSISNDSEAISFYDLDNNYIKASHSITGDGKFLSSYVPRLKNIAAATGDAVVKVYAHAGTYGTNSYPTGTALATSSTVDVSTISTVDFELVTFNFSLSNRILLETGTYYCFVLEYSDGDAVNKLSVSLTDNVVGGNAARYYYLSTNWLTDSALDVYFYIYTYTNPASGNRITPEIDISTTKPARTAIIKWDETLNSGNAAVVQTNLALNGVDYAGYQTVTKGGGIYGIDSTTDLSTAKLLVKTTLSTDNIANLPQIDLLALSISDSPIVMVDSVFKTGYVREGTLSVNDTLNSRSTAGLTFVDTTGVYRPDIGDPIEIYYNDGIIFGGIIAELEEGLLDDKVTLVNDAQCVDYSQIADRHIVAKTYENYTCKAIVEDIIDTYFTGDGVTTDYVETGQTITKATFNYLAASECFNELCDTVGYSWYIDYFKNLRFFARDTNTAPISLTDTSTNYMSLKVQRTLDQYHNKYYLRAGKDLIDARTEAFKGDDETQTFTLSFPVGVVPSSIIRSDTTAAQTIGINGVDSGYDWYWNKDEPNIAQDSGGVVLPSTGTLSVTYQGLVPIIISQQVDTQIAARAAAEGGSGVYEAIEDDPNVDSLTLAEDKITGILRKYGEIPVKVSFATDETGLRAGQLLPITNTAHSLSSSYLIDSVDFRDYGGGQYMRTSVRALSGESLGGWVDFFAKMAAGGKQFVVRENEVLTLVRNVSEVITISDTLTTHTDAILELEVGGYFYDDYGRVAEVMR